jgi:aryl-alcohol dehydrogenase-like predicted oxidoreductase
MHSRTLGDRQVGAIGLGAMPFSTQPGFDPGRSARTVHAALDAGVTLIDTADAYGPEGMGVNETLVAAALASYGGNTEDVVVATKAGHTRNGRDWGLDGSPAHLRRAAEASLRRLSGDALDLLQHHRPDPDVPYAETMGALKDLHDDGLVRRVGISNADPEQIRLAHAVLGEALVSVQNQFSPAFRSSEPEIAVCEELGLAFLPWSPLGGMRQAKELGSEFAPFARVAATRGVSPQRVCLAWELAMSPRVIPIPGASRPESVVDSVAAADLTLTAEEVVLLSG